MHVAMGTHTCGSSQQVRRLLDFSKKKAYIETIWETHMEWSEMGKVGRGCPAVAAAQARTHASEQTIFWALS